MQGRVCVLRQGREREADGGVGQSARHSRAAAVERAEGARRLLVAWRWRCGGRGREAVDGWPENREVRAREASGAPSGRGGAGRRPWRTGAASAQGTLHGETEAGSEGGYCRQRHCTGPFSSHGPHRLRPKASRLSTSQPTTPCSSSLGTPPSSPQQRHRTQRTQTHRTHRTHRHATPTTKPRASLAATHHDLALLPHTSTVNCDI